MKQNHVLTIRPRKNQITVDGICSCAKWRVVNRTRAEVRESHAGHLQHVLGPEGTERVNR